jgi:diguanylate cyclase (GGDEF)-like protein
MLHLVRYYQAILIIIQVYLDIAYFYNLWYYTPLMSTMETNYVIEPVFPLDPSSRGDAIQGRLFTVIDFGEPALGFDCYSAELQTPVEEQPTIPGKAEWHARFDNMVKHAGNTGEPISALFADLDGFKVINDKFGHQEGDRAIVEIEEIFSYLSYTPGRVGGDEFALAAPVGSEDIDAIVLQVKDAFAEVMSRPENVHLLNEGLGITIGAATLKSGMTGSDLLKQADEAMYFAKLESLHLNERQKAAFNAGRLLFQEAGIRLRDVMKLARKYPLENDTI